MDHRNNLSSSLDEIEDDSTIYNSKVVESELINRKDRGGNCLDETVNCEFRLECKTKYNSEYKLNCNLKRQPFNLSDWIIAENGLLLCKSFVTEEEEQDLIEMIDAGEWSGNGTGSNPHLLRRLQQFGALYLTDKRVLLPSDDKIPQFCLPVKERLEKSLKALNLADELCIPFNYVVFNEYLPSQGIAPHTDAHIYGPVICSLSLASDCTMSFYKVIDGYCDKENATFSIELPRRSMLVMSGEIRSGFQHSISKNLIDVTDNGREIERKRRISVIFRTFDEELIQMTL